MKRLLLLTFAIGLVLFASSAFCQGMPDKLRAPEGGNGATYLVLAGMGCFGAIILRRRA